MKIAVKTIVVMLALVSGVAYLSILMTPGSDNLSEAISSVRRVPPELRLMAGLLKIAWILFVSLIGTVWLCNGNCLGAHYEKQT